MWAELAVHDHLSAKQRERDIRAAHIAGLKEALKISNDCGKGWRKVGRDHEIFAVATDTVSKTIANRIKVLEDQNG